MSVLSTDISDQDIDFNHGNIDNEYVPCEYRTVDMGTGILWCEYNLGAFPGNKHSDWYGDYYAWGETETKDEYSHDSYKYGKKMSDKMTKYNKKDKLNRLDPSDDIICKTLCSNFRMPTMEEYQKLVDKTTNKWVKNYNGVHALNGVLFTAENGNTLFFPAAGYRYCSDVDGIGMYANFWSSTICSDRFDFAYSLYIDSDNINAADKCVREYGQTIRGVRNIL